MTYGKQKARLIPCRQSAHHSFHPADEFCPDCPAPRVDVASQPALYPCATCFWPYVAAPNTQCAVCLSYAAGPTVPAAPAQYLLTCSACNQTFHDTVLPTGPAMCFWCRP